MDLTQIVAYVVLLAAFVTACGIIFRALRHLWHAVRDLERRVQKLHDLSDPNGTDKE